MKDRVLPAAGVIERLLLLAGLLMLGRWVMVTQEARAYQTWAATMVDSDAPGEARASTAGRQQEVVGRILIPRLGTSTVIAEGVEPGTLRKAVGHIPSSALPGEPGNVVLAGHRDTYFSGLGKLRAGDAVRLQTRRRTYLYRVESARVTAANAVDVMRPTRRPALTLVTCYPFSMIGPAPHRYVVRAKLVGWEPEAIAQR